MFTAGIPGLSAYIGLTEVAKAKAGETIGRRVMSETSRAGHVYFFRVVRKVLSDGAVSSNDSFFICPAFNPNTGGGGELWVNPPPPTPNNPKTGVGTAMAVFIQVEGQSFL